MRYYKGKDRNSIESPISSVLEKALRKNNMTDMIANVTAIQRYRELAGDIISKLSKNIRIENGVMYVSLQSSGLRQELFYRSESLRQKINEKIGREYIKKIVFQ